MCEKKLSGIKISILTLGCKVNAYESDAMAALLKSEGAEMVDTADPADVYIINTCSVTNIGTENRDRCYIGLEKCPKIQ